MKPGDTVVPLVSFIDTYLRITEAGLLKDYNGIIDAHDLTIVIAMEENVINTSHGAVMVLTSRGTLGWVWADWLVKS